MITELAVELVEFTCGHCWRQWSCDYDVQRYTDDTGNDWEYFALDGHPAQSPYTPGGAHRASAIAKYTTTCGGSFPPARWACRPRTATASSITSRGTDAASTPIDTRSGSPPPTG